MKKQYKETRKSPRFHGRFFTWRVTRFTNQENGVKAVFLVFSSGKREVVKKYLWHKLVWDQLTKIELELFLVLLRDSDYAYWSFLKLLVFVPKKILRKNLNAAETKLGLPITNRESYLGLQRLDIEIQEEIRNLPKPPKFSGWIRSLSSRGKTLTGEKGIEPLSSAPSEYHEYIDFKQLWEALLSDRR